MGPKCSFFPDGKYPLLPKRLLSGSDPSLRAQSLSLCLTQSVQQPTLLHYGYELAISSCWKGYPFIPEELTVSVTSKGITELSRTLNSLSSQDSLLSGQVLR